LQGAEGIPTLLWYGEEGDFRIMVTNLLGPSLEDLFDYCHRKFSLKTVLLLTEQFLYRLQYLHEKNFVHRDVKPANFLMGLGKKADKLFMIDFGLARKYRDSRTNLHIPTKEDKTLTGTARYASINAHLGIEQSRRDDLEALGYVLVYFLKGGLPWQGLQISGKKEKYEKILEKKVATPAEVLCKDLPEEFAIFLKYSKTLKFEERPDYMWIQRIFKDLAIKLNFQKDLIFDWAVISINSEKKLKEEEEMMKKKKIAIIEEKIITGVLKTTIISCKNLPNFDMVGGSDAYCVITLINSSGNFFSNELIMMATEVSNSERFQRKTEVLHDTNDPVWNYEFEIKLSLKEKDYEGLMMMIEVWDHDLVGDELIGRTKIQLKSLWKRIGIEKEWKEGLRDKKGEEWKDCKVEGKFKWVVL